MSKARLADGLRKHDVLQQRLDKHDVLLSSSGAAWPLTTPSSRRRRLKLKSIDCRR